MRKLMFFSLGFSSATFLILTEYSKLLSFLVLVILGLASYWRLELQEGKRILKYLSLGALVALAYVSAYTQIHYQSGEEYYGETRLIHGIVKEFPEKTHYSYSLVAEVFLDDSSYIASLYMDQQASQLSVGDQFWITAQLRSPLERFSGEATTYYSAQGISLRGTTSGVLQLEKAEKIPLKYLPTYLAHWLKQGIYQVFPSEYAGTVHALVSGNRDGLEETFSSSLERTGLSHTVAVSGMHLAFLAGILRFMLPNGKKSTACLVIFIMVLFMCVSGCTPSVMRATVMIVLLQLAPLFGRERDDFTALSTALLIILLENPYAVNHIGLHLSLASVLGILLFSTGMQKKLETLWKKKEGFIGFSPLYFLISSFSSTYGAMLLTIPLIAIYFETVSLIAPLSNLLTLWAVTTCFAGGLLCGMLAWVSLPLATLISIPFRLILAYIHWIIPLLGNNTFAAISTHSPYFRYWVAFLYGIILYFIFHKEAIPWKIPLFCSIMSFLLCFQLHREAFFRSPVAVDVFDVGQGQSILFTLGNHMILSDCGGDSLENPGNMVADTLQSLGKRSLDLLVISHFDTDHCNGVLALLERIQVQVLAIGDIQEENPLQQEILAKAEEMGTFIWHIQQESEIILEDGYEIRLFPPVGRGANNERSISLLLSYGDFDLLSTGDMGQISEEILTQRFPLPEIDVFVVGHHGSKFSTSDSFLEAITPKAAIISAGEHNVYGHPATETLDRLQEWDVKVYRSDILGRFRITL